MSRSDGDPGPLTFWHCRACGTPNPRAVYLTHCLGCGAARPGPGSSSAPAWHPIRQRFSSWLAGACWAYAAAVLVVLGLLRWLGDIWWLATVLLYGPRWIWAVPLAVLIPASAWLRPRSLPVLLAVAIIVAGPIMGVRVPWRAWIPRGWGQEPTLRILSCNLNVANPDPRALAELIRQTTPDVVALQEWPGWDESALFPGPDWCIWTEGGVCLASRYPIRCAERLGEEALGWDGVAVRYRLAAPRDDILVVVLHLESPREGLEAIRYGRWQGIPGLRANIALRSRQSDAISPLVAGAGGPLLIAGDFNLTDDSTIFRRNWSAYRDAFAAAGLGLGHTKRTRWFGARIDHILAGPAWRIRRCWVGPDIGSDHRPLIADLNLGDDQD